MMPAKENFFLMTHCDLKTDENLYAYDRFIMLKTEKGAVKRDNNNALGKKWGTVLPTSINGLYLEFVKETHFVQNSTKILEIKKDPYFLA